MTKNLLITGGSGYMGSRFIYRLLKETNINIVNYDISLFGDKHLPKDPRFKYLNKILQIQSNLKNQLIITKLSTVLYLACISVMIRLYELNPELLYENKIMIVSEDLVRKFHKNKKLKNLYMYLPALCNKVYQASS